MSGAIRSFRDLVAWQRAFRLAIDVIRALKTYPPEERFGLASQMRRACVSISSNIAEGFGRGSRLDYTRCLYISRGSLYELQTQIELSGELGYLTDEQCQKFLAQSDEVSRVLGGLIGALESAQA